VKAVKNLREESQALGSFTDAAGKSVLKGCEKKTILSASKAKGEEDVNEWYCVDRGGGG